MGKSENHLILNPELGMGTKTAIYLPQHWRKDQKQKRFVDILKVSMGANIRNRYNQVPHMTQDTNGKVKTTHSYTPQTRAKR